MSDRYLAPAPTDPLGNPPEEGLQIDYVSLVRRYGLVAVLLILLGTAAGVLAVAVIPPKYTARTLLEVQPLGSSMLKLQAVQSVQEGEDVNVALLTEAQKLQTATFLRKVIKRLELNGNVSPALERKDFFGKVRRFLNIGSQDTPLENAQIDGLEVEHLPKALAVALRTLDAHPVNRTRLIEVTCDSTNPQLAADFLNALGETFKEENYQSRIQVVQTTSQWLSQQLEDARRKMVDAETKLQEFNRTSGNIFVSQESTLADSKLQGLQQRISDAETELISKKARYDAVQKTPPELLGRVIDDPSLRGYETQIAALRQKRAELTTTLTADNPRVQKIDAQIAELQQALKRDGENIKNRIITEYQAAKDTHDLLVKAYGSQARVVGQQAALEGQYTILKRESDTARATYNAMLAQANEANIAGSIPVNNVQVVEPAVPPITYKPKPIMIIGLGAMGGLGLCVGIAFLREKADQRMNTPRQVRFLNVPQLGVIPSVEEEQNRGFLSDIRRQRTPAIEAATINGPISRELTAATQDPDKQLLAESSRITLASLIRESMAGDGIHAKVILITSPAPGEGKTTITTNLGLALAETGRRVLVLDGDFRRPRLHKALGIPNTTGIADLLEARTPIKDYELEALAVRTPSVGLSVLPNGRRVENIAKILYSPRFRELMERLRREFDMILIDAPPILQVADARVMSEMADGVVLVIRAGVTERSSVVEAIEQLRNDRVPVLGTVFNDWKPTKSQLHKYYYYTASETPDGK